MTTIKEWILEEANGELIQAIVIGDTTNYQKKTCYHIPESYPQKQILSWEEALPWIDYQFDDGFGIEQCFPIFAWTENKVIAISCYDGSTSCFSIPRNPCVCAPFMRGSG